MDSHKKLWDPYPTWAYTPKGLRAELCQIQSNSSSISQKKFRIVICSYQKAGKSSSINNILAALEGKYAQTANVGDHSQVTKAYTEYSMLIGKEKNSSYLICDTPGIRTAASEEEKRVQTETIIGTILGKFQHGEEVFCPNLTMAELNAKTIKTDCAFGVIFVIDGMELLREAADNLMTFQSLNTILQFTQMKDEEDD